MFLYDGKQNMGEFINSYISLIRSFKLEFKKLDKSAFTDANSKKAAGKSFLLI